MLDGTSGISRFQPLGLNRTKEQIEIQTAKQKIVLVNANAGAAKTTTLALRIGEALANNIAPEAVLALVFTETARDVLKGRLKELGIHYSIVKRLTIATFDEFSTIQLAKIEDRHVPVLDGDRLQREPMLLALKNVYERYGDKVDGLQLANHNTALSQFLDGQLRLKARMALSTNFELDDLEIIYDLKGVTATEYLAAIEYERIRLGNGYEPNFRAKFDSTYDLAKDIKKEDGSLVQLDEYRLVVCDELHDLNEAAFTIISALISKPHCSFVGVGDKDQVIHATLGASSEFLDSRFVQDFPKSNNKYQLSVTFRHGPYLAYAMAEFMGKTIESHVADRFDIQLSKYKESHVDATYCIVNAIKLWQEDGFSINQCAILIRERHQAILIENMLRIHRINYRTPKMGSYLQRKEILFLRGIICIAFGDLFSIKSYEVRGGIVEALALYGELSLDYEELEKAKKELANEAQLKWFYERYISGKNSNESTRLLDESIRYVMNLPPDTMAAGVLRAIVERMKMYDVAAKLYIRPFDASIVGKTIDGFVALAENGNMTLLQLWETMNSAESFVKNLIDKNTVTLDCVESVKGHEFGHVIIPFMEIDEFPSSLSSNENEENLFYVGATRAKYRLTLVMPQNVEKQSSFIGRMKISSIRGKANLAAERNEKANTTQVPTRYYLNTKFAEKDVVKLLGAKYDQTRKSWYVLSGVDLKPFERWL